MNKCEECGSENIEVHGDGELEEWYECGDCGEPVKITMQCCDIERTPSDNSEDWEVEVDCEWIADRLTRDQAIKLGKEEAKKQELDSFKIGKRKTIGPISSHIFADDVIETIACRMYDEFGEGVEDILNSTTKYQEEELEQDLRKVIDRWADKYGIGKGFYAIEDYEEFYIGKGGAK